MLKLNGAYASTIRQQPVGLWWSRREFGCARTDDDGSPAHGGSIGQESPVDGPHRRLRRPTNQSPTGCQVAYQRQANRPAQVAGFASLTAASRGSRAARTSAAEIRYSFGSAVR